MGQKSQFSNRDCDSTTSYIALRFVNKNIVEGKMSIMQPKSINEMLQLHIRTHCFEKTLAAADVHMYAG